jgi:hypothetical protein
MESKLIPLVSSAMLRRLVEMREAGTELRRDTMSDTPLACGAAGRLCLL